MIDRSVTGVTGFSLFLPYKLQDGVYRKKREKYIECSFHPVTLVHPASAKIALAEKDIVAAILRYLKSLPQCFAFKEHGGMYGTAGIPDIICCYKGRFLGLEVKQPTGRLTELQKRAIEKINTAGGIALRVESVSDVKNIILTLDNETKEVL